MSLPATLSDSQFGLENVGGTTSDESGLPLHPDRKITNVGTTVWALRRYVAQSFCASDHTLSKNEAKPS